MYPGRDFNQGPISRLQSSQCLPSTAPPPPSVAILFIYRTIKKSIRKMRLYKFIHVAYRVNPNKPKWGLALLALGPDGRLNGCTGCFSVMRK